MSNHISYWAAKSPPPGAQGFHNIFVYILYVGLLAIVPNVGIIRKILETTSPASLRPVEIFKINYFLGLCFSSLYIVQVIATQIFLFWKAKTANQRIYYTLQTDQPKISVMNPTRSRINNTTSNSEKVIKIDKILNNWFIMTCISVVVLFKAWSVIFAAYVPEKN